MALLTIGATALKNPKEGAYLVVPSDLDSESSGRSETALMTRTRIAVKYKVQATFVGTRAEIKVITDLVAPVSFSCTFFNVFTGGYTTATMYSSADKPAKLVRYLNEAAPEDSIWELPLSFIQY